MKFIRLLCVFANVSNRTIDEDMVECPVKGCNETVVQRGLYMHIFQTDDPPGEGHYPRFEEPPYLDMEDVKITGETQEVPYDFPETVDLEEDTYYLDTYTGKAYQGKRGLMIHLGQMAGRENIPDNVTDRHDAEDFPIVDIDDDGNITEVYREEKGTVPPLAPYLPWYDDPDEGYIKKERVKELIREIEESETGAVTAEYIRDRLL
jgi:hypothetical protein